MCQMRSSKDKNVNMSSRLICLVEWAEGDLVNLFKWFETEQETTSQQSKGIKKTPSTCAKPQRRM